MVFYPLRSFLFKKVSSWEMLHILTFVSILFEQNFYYAAIGFIQNRNYGVLL